MQALENYEKELQKAFAKIEKDLERHKDVFTRLESELQAVKAFEQQDSALYAAIRDAYEQEQFEENPDKHCQGVISAVNAIYNLGYANGFKAGAEERTKQNGK